ncbi:MAG: DoxX family protein [Candidatus Aenigmarchaeota archaeon]|nr:DoxX family protein [Candidatus Aenigmarchaeota archaeon]
MANDKSEYGPTLLRLVLGPLFLIPGFSKLANPSMITQMLEGLGFPAPAFFGWLLLLSEIIFGASVLLGWKVKYTVWPLTIVLLVAVATVYVPKLATDPMAMISVLFHALGIAALISLSLTGPGALAISKE